MSLESAPLVQCRGVDVRYGERRLVRALDLDVHRGERWVMVGPNGAGKSSLLMTLAGVRPADGGAVRFQGRDAADWEVQELAGLRAVVADRWADPFPVSVLETVAAARYHLRGDAVRRGAHDADHAAAGRCLADMDCANLATRDVRTLSRGERQRVAVAAAMAQDTVVMLLDEPISHQDPRHQIQLLSCLERRGHCTYLAALHDINAAARFGTHALLLHGDGRWESGRAEEVLTPARLSPLFDTAITQVVVGQHRVFVSTGGTAA